MAKQFDIESFMDYFLGVFKAQLNDKIDAINTEKADSITLEHFSDVQYICDTNAEVVNYTQFIYYGFPEIRANESNGGGISESITMSFEVVIPMPNGGIDDNRRIMRYTRALKEVAFENALKNSQISDLTIETFSPVTVENNLFSPLIKVGSISLTGVITN